ncbi:hypothetical protein Agub_g10538 [Astrephomene gubernaculifera]|uniref:DUF8204 domain-containing protein n=1 Tax=Astrephomene gubernaculifera TaxID=47775 RepID=A0AAD3DX22_9CHLO|nr:hypothetical protein Agub_g10538 [Astrephomene gubernaculifera]
MANKNGSNEGPGAKCCLGVTYFNRTLERNGAAPKCLGLAQLKHGDQADDDVKMLSDSTGEFKYYCIGYASHRNGARPAGPGEPTQMPFCEGVEVVLTEEMSNTTPAPGGPFGSSPRSSRPIQPALNDVASRAPSHAATAAPAAATAAAATGESDQEGPQEDQRFKARFRRQLHKNLDLLRLAATGEKLPELPIPLRKHESFASVRQTFTETASLNLLKMRVAAEFISSRTADAMKPVWKRLRSGEEAD